MILLDFLFNFIITNVKKLLAEGVIMEKKIFFEDARKNVLEFFSIEFPSLTINEVDTFISIFYKLINYEEESKKIRPNILITSNINSIIRNVPSSKKILFYEDEDISNFKARIKALMCFCRSDWSIYINFGESIIEYGIVKTLTSIKEKSLIQIVKQKSTLETISKRSNLIILNVIGGGVCQLTGARGNKCSVCFNLNSQTEYNWDNEIDEFVEACVSKIKTTQKKLVDIKTLTTNIFHRVLRDSHGTLCIVVDKEYKDKGFLSDGTWLKEPIEFGKLFLRSSKFDENVLRSYADVLTTMLDFDGITIIDNAGRIRAYNVFIESNPDKKDRIIGGARRRAAYTILQNKSKKIIGVYFQSQDGDNFYKEKSDLKKKKKKIKIVGGEVVNNENNDMLPLEIIAKLEQQKKKEEELEKEKERIRIEKEKIEKEKIEKDRLEKEKAEREKIEKEKFKLAVSVTSENQEDELHENIILDGQIDLDNLTNTDSGK